MDSQPSTEIKPSPSQYRSPINDNDSVDMSDVIMESWSLGGVDTEPEPLQFSQEIKLESYKFLGSRINYDDKPYRLDELPLPENYFKGEANALHYESEDDEDIRINGVTEIADDNVNGIIEIADESSEDGEDGDVVSLLNSSDETHNASTVSIRQNLDSIRSDHNYSSQEIFAGPFNEITETPEVVAPEPEPATEPILEPIDHVNEMQALIASWLHDSSSENKTTILNNLESEIKRIKETMLGSQPIPDTAPESQPAPDTMLDSQPGPKTQPPADDVTPVIANVSDDEESDSGFMMSEGHSEPLEYRGAVLTESESASEKMDEVTVKKLEDLRAATDKIASGMSEFSKMFSDDTFSSDTATEKLTRLKECGNEFIKSVEVMATSLKVDIDGCVDENSKIGTDKTVENDCVAKDDAESQNLETAAENVADQIDDKIESNADEGSDINGDTTAGISDDKIVDENVDENINENDVEKSSESIDSKLNGNSDDTIEENIDDVAVVEDKQKQLDLKSKRRWLASSSEDNQSSSDDSYSEKNVTVKRRKKRARTTSSSSSSSSSSASSSTDKTSSSKNPRKKNVLLDSSDDEQSENGADAAAAVDTVQCSEDSVEKDADMANYLQPSDAPTNASVDSEIGDDNLDDGTDQRIDSELEEFFGFDMAETTSSVVGALTSDLGSVETIADVIPEIDVIKPTCDNVEPTETTNGNVSDSAGDAIEPICDVTEPPSDDIEQTTDVNEPVTQEHTSDSIEPTSDTEDIISPTIPYVQSEQWELPENSLVFDDEETDEILEGNISPKKEVDVDHDQNNVDYHNEDDAVEHEDQKAEDDNVEENHNGEEVDEYDTDDEINRLVDFSNIPTKVRPVVNHVPVYKKRPASKPPKPKEDILDILKDSVSQDIESESSSEEDIISEEQFVLQLAKQQCLKDSSESDGEDSESADDEDDEDKSSVDDITDESNDSKVNNFLKKRLAHEIKNDLVGEVKPEESAPKDIPVDEFDVYEEKDEQDLELQSSGIFEPEIELHDGLKLSDDNDANLNGEETSEQPQKPPEEKKKWKLDKIAFSKNLFNNLDDLDDDKPAKTTANSDNSDCEMLDISMFKTKKGDGDLDKIIQNQKKRDVSKVSSKVADECISLSSDSDLEIDKGTIDDDSDDEKPTTKSRPMLRNDQLAGETKQAQKEEIDRLKRLEKKTERLTQIVESQSQQLSQSHDDSDVILDFDSKQKCAISVHPEIVKNLKEHQIAGVKFMYDCCYGSVDSIEKHNGSGCILAHCMGLGKTLQLIALLHTLIRYPQLKTKKILVICPKSTIMNWADEIQTWLRSVKVKLKVLHFPDPSDINKKLQILREWHAFKADPEGRAGCMLIGYEAFRSLVFYADRSKPEMSQSDMDRIKKMVEEYLLKPGADLVVCDEGHVIKNRKSTTSRAVNKISSRRRIILTGTPIQNNLKEYYSMVNFIKPSFLGTEKEFANLYENPIKEGQHKDSNNAQIRIMKQRSYVLHKKLSKFVQRREAALLKTFLPEKYEYVLFCPMTELQNQLYQHFLDNNPLKEKYGGKSLIPDYTFLRKIWTHPKVLENAWKNAVALRDKRIAARRRNMDSDEEPDDVLDSQVGKMSVENDWWRQFIEPQDLRSLLPSNKLRILFEILRLCEQNREKCLIFSAFVAVLDVVEYFMQQIHNKTSFNDGSDLGLENLHGSWEKNFDYYRLDGKTSKALRHAMIRNFNDPNNERVKCFLISAKAGGQGINLVGANRVILLDTSWNPSNDQQNIFRVFRLGQQSKCYIYRLLAMGTMEEKVYSRSVTKQAMSFRVVDEQQIDRHYSLAELAELYTLTKPDPAEQPTPVRPVDNILANLLRNFKSLVYKYHEHDSLLENNSAEDLNEQEKADAWEAYEKDVSMKNQFGNMNITADGSYGSPYGGFGLNMLNPYGSYIPQNLPSSMIPSYLQRMGYTGVGVEQELMLMSQMYSQYNQSGGSAAYGQLNSFFNSPSSSSTNALYNAANSNYFKSTTNTTNTTTSPPSYSDIASSVFNGLNQMTSSSSSAVAAQYNLGRLMQSYSGSSSYPFNLYPSAATSTNTAQPGPNAIKNPLLSNLLPPSTSITKDSFSIPTSVITKASKDVQRAAPNTSINPVSSLSSISMSPSTSQINQKTSTHSSLSTSSKGNSLTVARASPLSNARSSPLSSARGSPLSSARASPLSSARVSPLSGTSSARASPSIVSRSSPSINRPSVEGTNSLSISRSSTTAHKSNHNNTTSLVPLSITLSSNRTSPEPNIIVKDVNAINKTIARKAAPSKAPAQPIRNFNMGIVYPKVPEKKAFDLSQNDQLLKAAKNQLQQNAARLEPQNRISLPPSPSSRNANRLPVNRIPNVKTGVRPAATTTATTTTTSRAMDRSVSSSSLTSIVKNHLSSPNLPTNEVTITPTKRLHKLSLPTSSIHAQKLSSSTVLSSATSHKSSPIEINKLSNQLSVSRVPSSTSITRQLPNATSSASISRQTSMPSTSLSVANVIANANKLTGRLQIPPKSIPKLSNQPSTTMPTLKLISTPSNSSHKIGATGGTTTTTSRPTLPAVSRSLVSRVVATNNGVNKVTLQRPVPNTNTKVFTSSPAPKLVNFSNSASESRKRKLEELIPKNTGVTLIKKPKPREPMSSVEIVELD